MYYLELLTTKIKNLIETYEQYIWKEDNRELIVIFQNNDIEFHLYDNSNCIDEITISFSQKENKLYKAMCLRIFSIMLGNVKIREENSIFYNIKQKPYFIIVVTDKEIRETLIKLVSEQEINYINFNNKIIKDSTQKLKWKINSIKFLNDLEKRIDVTKKTLRRW